MRDLYIIPECFPSTVLNHLQANRFQSNDDVLRQLFQ